MDLGGLDVNEYLTGFRIIARRKTGSGRPGKQVSNEAIVALGKAFIAGKPVCTTAERLGISRRTASRWIKRLNLRQLAS
jgi:DNA invertase Pin-like site-specific DNA recombinase